MTAAGVLILAVSLSLAPLAGASSASPSVVRDDEITGYADDDSFRLGLTGSETVDFDNAGNSQPDFRITESSLCGAGAVFAAGCAGGGLLDAAEQCVVPEDSTIAATDIQVLLPTGEWSAPEINSLMNCNDPGAPVVFTAADFRALALVPSAIVVGPPGGWLPVNMVNVVYTDATAQVIDTALLGQAVRVRATPQEFTWEWDDGTSPLTTSDPGAPHPNHTVSHTYTKVGTYSVSMVTQWSGEYSLDGGTTYTPIDGTATTTSTAAPVTVTELRSRLVEDPVG